LKKTILVLTLITLVICSLCSCGSRAQTGKQDTDKVLYDNGLKMISLMAEMADSDDYISFIMSAPSDFLDQIDSGDYSAPSKVFKVTVPDGVAKVMLEAYDMEVPELSDRLLAEMDRRVVSSAATRLTGMSGAETLAAVSILTTGDQFLCEGLEHSVIYLYYFQNGTPVMITFTPGDENIVSASGSFVVYDELNGADEDDLAALFTEGAYLPNCEVEQLEGYDPQ
jgi:hypothetical protein